MAIYLSAVMEKFSIVQVPVLCLELEGWGGRGFFEGRKLPIYDFFLGLRLSLFLHLPQHGFHKHRSCETQPDITWHEINYLIDSGEEVDAVVLDFSNAFDKVFHPKLIFKLQNLSISTLLVDWIANWLKDRSKLYQ